MIRKLLSNISYRTTLSEIFFLFFVSLIPLFWLTNGMLIFGHDIGFPLNPTAWFLDKLFLWSSKINNFGGDISLFGGILSIHAFESFFSFLNFSIFSVQRLLYIFWFLAPVFAMYYFVYTCYPEREHRWLRIFSSLFYIFNFFILTRFTIFERVGFSMMVAVPLVIAFVRRYLRKETSLVHMSFFVGIVMLLFNSGGIPPFIGIFFLVIFLFLLWYGISFVKTRRELLQIFFIGVLLVILFILLNAYWVLPFFYSQISAYSRVVEGDFSGIIHWLIAVSANASFLNLFKLQAVWDVSNPLHYAAFFTRVGWGIIVSTIFPLIVFSAFFFIRDRRDRFFIFFFSFVSLLFIFFAAGTHPPFGEYYEWMMRHIPFFAIYRTPLYKFSYGVVFGFAFLFGFGMQQIITFLKKKIINNNQEKAWVANVIGIAMLIFFFAGQNLYFKTTPFNLWENFNLRIQPPSYVFAMGEYLQNKSDNERLLLLPPLIEQYGSVDAYTWGFWSLTPLPRLLIHQDVVVNQGPLGEVKRYHDVYDSLKKGDFDEVVRQANRLAIRSFLLRKDVAYKWNVGTDDPTVVERILQKKKDYFSEVKIFGEWSLYTLKQSPSIVDIIQNVQKPSPIIRVEHMNQTKYRIRVENASVPFSLILKNTFDQGWRLYQEPKERKLFGFTETWFKKYLPKRDHFTGYGLFNGWRVTPPAENFDIIIEYWPQRLFYIGGGVTALSVLTLLGIFIALQIKKFRNREKVV